VTILTLSLLPHQGSCNSQAYHFGVSRFKPLTPDQINTEKK